MGKKKKKNIHNKREPLYIVTGITDVYYGRSNDSFKIGFDKAYILGIYNDVNKLFEAMDYLNDPDFELSGCPLEPYFIDNRPLNWIIIDRIITDDSSFVTTAAIDMDSDYPRLVYKYEDNDKVGYYRVSSSDNFTNVYNKIMTSNEGYDILSSPVINLNNTMIELNNGNITLDELDESKFDDIDPDEVPFDSNDDVKDAIKEFVTNKDTSVTINDKEIKTESDVDNLSDEDINFIKDSMNTISEMENIDSFFVVD